MSQAPLGPDKSTLQFILILVGVVGSIIVGTLFTMRFQTPRHSSRASALGHTLPAAPTAAASSLVWIAGGTFPMGSDDGETHESPVHAITLDGFWIGTTEVSNEEFEKFVQATGYRTTAEQAPKLENSYPERGTNTVPGSMVFLGGSSTNATEDWRFVAGANWRQPEGPGSTIRGREKHPVVQVSWLDAVAYANWAGQRLPTEAEWEFAARGGLYRQAFVWGKDLPGDPTRTANLAWEAGEHGTNSVRATVPVGRFPANRYGLRDISGNVAEWCHDWYRADYYLVSPKMNPKGPEESLDPAEPTVGKKVVRGGSFVTSNPAQFRSTTRMKFSPYASYSDVGFRCARSVK